MDGSRAAALALLVGLSYPASRAGGEVPLLTVETKLVGSGLISGSNFGETVVVLGDVMAIGAPDHYVPADAPGSVYIFVRSGGAWLEHSRLFAADGVLGDEFGAALALDGDTLLVGAPSRNGPSGEFEGGAYIFDRAPNGTWTQQVKLLPQGVGSPDRFGEHVALAGDLAVVLSAGTSTTGFQVYPFARNAQGQWAVEPPLDPPFAAQDVKLVGTTLALTGIFPDEKVGIAVYERAGARFTLETLLTGCATGFLTREAFDGETLAVAPIAFLSPPELCVFAPEPPGAWVEQPLVPPEVGRQATFGAAMAVHGDRLAVGLLNDPTDDFDSVLLFVPDGQAVWHPLVKLVPPAYPIDDGFGGALSTDGETLAIGAVEDSGSAGAVFVAPFGAPAPGEVPASLTLGRASGAALTLSWSASCEPGATDYEIYEGQLGDFTSHAPLACTTGGMTEKTLVPSSADSYYLIVPRTATHEGSYGRASDGSERAPSASPCLPQQISHCE